MIISTRNVSVIALKEQPWLFNTRSSKTNRVSIYGCEFARFNLACLLGYERDIVLGVWALAPRENQLPFHISETNDAADLLSGIFNITPA